MRIRGAVVWLPLLVLASPAAADNETFSQVSRLLSDAGTKAEVFDAHVYVTVGCFGAEREQCLDRAQQIVAEAGFDVQRQNLSLIVKRHEAAR